MRSATCTRSASSSRTRWRRHRRCRRASRAAPTSAACGSARRPTWSCSTIASRSAASSSAEGSVSPASARGEIAEQPAVVAALLENERRTIERLAAEVRRRRPRYVVIAARGSSDNAARYAQHVLGRLAGLPVVLATPSLHTLYDAPPRFVDALVIGISQSGASPDVVSVVADGARQGAMTAAITNDPGSPLAAVAAHVIDLGAGAERSVAATKTYTASLAAIAWLAAAAAGDHAREAELGALPEALAAQLGRDGDVAAALPAVAEWERLTVVGRGPHYAAAVQAAPELRR